MCDSNGAVGSWAAEVETENENNNNSDVDDGMPKSSRMAWKSIQSNHGPHPSSPSPKKPLVTDDRDLRHRLRRSRGEDNRATSPPRSTRSNARSAELNHRQLPGSRRDERELQGANYRREKDGLSPLRSPLNSDQRTSRVNHNTRRRSNQNEEDPSRTSPSKRNRNADDSSATSPLARLNPEKEEHRFRRRLDLPARGVNKDVENDSELLEDDKATIARREKQIQYGKATYSYKMYRENVLKNERLPDRKIHPRTPVKSQKCSRRNWDAQIKAWKKYVHQWANANGFQTPLGESDSTSSQVTDKGSSVASDEETVGEAEPIVQYDNADILDLNDEEDISFLEGFDLEKDLKSL